MDKKNLIKMKVPTILTQLAQNYCKCDRESVLSLRFYRSNTSNIGTEPIVVVFHSGAAEVKACRCLISHEIV